MALCVAPRLGVQARGPLQPPDAPSAAPARPWRHGAQAPRAATSSTAPPPNPARTSGAMLPGGAPSYRVLLHNDSYNRREYVVQVLMKVVEGTTVDDAVNIMQEAHVNGLALVTQCSQEKAELYCESLRLNGLISTIEPADGGSDGTSSS